MVNRSSKIWGVKNNIFGNDTCAVDILNLEPQKRCSWHFHKNKYNLFYCVSGVVFIEVEELGQRREIELKEGQFFTIIPCQNHMFFTKEEPAVLTEVMFVNYDPDDIVRHNVGGERCL